MLSGWEVPGTPENRRPVTVTVACVLLAVVAALVIAQGLLSLRDYFAGMDAYEQTAESPHEAFAGLGVLFQIVFCGGKIVIAVLFALLALFNAIGRSWARITTFSVGGPWLLCCAAPCGAWTGTHGSVPASTAEDAALTARKAELVPAWHTPTLTAIEIAIPVVLLIVLILLVLPVSTRYYLKPQQLPVYVQPEWAGTPVGQPAFPPGTPTLTPSAPTLPAGRAKPEQTAPDQTTPGAPPPPA